MTEAALPAAVNWFHAHAVHVAHEGEEPLLAAAAKHLVFVARLARKKPEYTATLVGFKKGSKIAAVCFGRTSDGQPVLLAAAGRELCVWPLQSVLRDSSPAHKSTRVASDVRAVTACEVHEGRLYIGTEQGQVLAVRVNNGFDVSVSAAILQATAPVSVLSTCGQRLAIGMTTGVVAIANVDAFPEYTMLGTHSDDVQSMAWCAGGRRLITSSRDQKIKIWDTTTLQQVQEISMDKRSSNVPYNRLWISVAVVKRPQHCKAAEKDQKAEAAEDIEQSTEEDEEELLIADPVGKMFTIRLDALQPTAATETGITFRKSKDATERSFEHKHSRPVFQLVACRNREWVLSVSMDRDVALWDVKSGKRLWVMHGFGGFVYSLADSPLGLVIGAGDNMVRRWDHTYSSREAVQVWWKGLKSTVTCVLPHPEEHSLVAVGDEAGRVCLLNTLNNQVATTAAPHRAPVSQLAWFAVKATEEEEEGGGRDAATKFELLSLCTEGRLKYQRRLLSSSDEDCTDCVQEQLVPGSTGTATKLSSVATTRSESASFFPSLMVSGTTTGTVGVFEFDQAERSWRLRAAFNDQVSAVTCCDVCCFSGSGTDSTSSGNEIQVWVASGGADGRVFVYTLRQSALAASASRVIDSSASVRGAYRHIRRVNDVKLCATNSGSLLLASASDDWSVQIWDCLRQTHVFNYRKHAGSVRCLAWAWEQSGRSVLFSGSEDQSVHKWSVEGALASSATPTTQPPTVQEIQHEKRKVGEDARTTREQLPDQKLAASTVTTTTASFSRVAAGPTATVPAAAAAMGAPTTIPSAVASTAATIAAAPAPAPAAAAARRKPKKPPRWLTLNAGSPESAATATGNFLKFIGSPATAAADEPIDAALLRTRDESDRCVQQLAAEREQSSPELAASTLLLKGDLIGAFDLVLKHDLVTAEWVAIAPALGPGMWDQVMRRYIAKLEAGGEIDAAIRAALAFGDPQWAVDLCLAQRWFHEAVAIARSHSFDDCATNDILRAWATALDQGGQSEQAARVFWAAGDFEVAVVALSRKGTLPGFLAALEAFKTASFASSPAWSAAQYQTFTLMAVAKAASLGDLSVVASILASQHNALNIERADAAAIVLGAVSGVCQLLDQGNAAPSITLPAEPESKCGVLLDLLPELSTHSREQLQHLCEVVGFLHELCSTCNVVAEVENGDSEAAPATIMAAARDKLAACVGRGIVSHNAVSRADSVVQCMAQWQKDASTKITTLNSCLAGVEPAQDRAQRITSSATKLLCGIWLHWAINDVAIRQLEVWQAIARKLFTD